MSEGIGAERAAMEDIYDDRSESRWAFHHTTDPLIRHSRDRRLSIALDVLAKHGRLAPNNQSVLIVRGGVGGEGTFLANQGFRDVTVSDFSAGALDTCGRPDPRLKSAGREGREYELDR